MYLCLPLDVLTKILTSLTLAPDIISSEAMRVLFAWHMAPSTILLYDKSESFTNI